MHQFSEGGVPLPFEQRMMLWSMRVWVIGVHHDIGAAARIQEVLERMGAKDATPYLDGFMFAISHGAKRRIAIHCACHPHVESDERILLDVLAAAQEGRSVEAFSLLHGLVHDQAATAVLRSAQGLGTELALAGLFLGGDEHGMSDADMTGTACPAPGRAGTTLH